MPRRHRRSARKSARITQGAAEQCESSDLDEINAAASKIKIQGARLPDAALRMTGR